MEDKMKGALRLVYPVLLGCFLIGCGRNGIIASGDDYELTVEDLRYEIRQLGPSTSYDGSPEDRRRIVENLAARHFLVEEALRRGYGKDELAEVEGEAEAGALAEAYRRWRIDSSITLPRIKTKKWIEKLDRRLHLKELRFAAYPAAEEALESLRNGMPFDMFASALEGRQDVMMEDMGWRVWKELARPVANIVFQLDRGAVTDIVSGSDGYHIFYLADDEPMGIGFEVLSLRSKRFVEAMEKERLLKEEAEDLVRLFDVEFSESGAAAGLEAFRIAFGGGRPADSLLDYVIASDGGDEQVLVADLFTEYYTMPAESRPYIGDYRAITDFAMQVLLPALEARAGRAMGMDRLREVIWSRKTAREELLVAMMEEDFGSQISVTDEDMRALYDERRDDLMTSGTFTARRLLLETRGEVRQARQQIASGRDFADIVREMSHDEVTAPEGGRLEGMLFGLLAVYDSVVTELRPGQISEPFETRDGIEILKLEDVVEPRALTFEEVEERLRAYLTNKRANGLLAQWVDARREETGFRVNEDLLNSVDLPMPDYKSYEPKRTRTVDVSGTEESEEAVEEELTE
jgi:peptidyl-prolyl cis-trans isomerase C